MLYCTGRLAETSLPASFSLIQTRSNFQHRKRFKSCIRQKAGRLGQRFLLLVGEAAAPGTAEPAEAAAVAAVATPRTRATAVIMHVAVCSVLKTGGRTKLPDRHRVIVGL